MMLSDKVSYGLDLLWETGLFRFMIPELGLQLNYNQNSQYHSFTLDTHTKKVVEATPKDLDLRWSALLHDIAKPFVRSENPKGYSNYIRHEKLGVDMVLRLAKHLNWSNSRRDKVVELVRNHLEDDCPLRQYDNISKCYKEVEK